MASIETRGNSVRFIVRLPVGDGTSEKKTRTFDNTPEGRALGQAWADALEAKKALGTAEGTAVRGMTCGQLWEAYEEVASKTDSKKWNLLRLRRWQKDPLAAKRIADTVTHDIDQWVDRQMLRPGRGGRTITAASVARELNLMSSTFTWAVKVRKWLKENPCHGAMRPQGFAATRKPKALTPKQIEAVCQASGFSSDPQLRTLSARVGAAWLLALETGMRSGEILRLRPEHFTPASRTVLVAAEERGGRKGGKSGRAAVSAARHVPLTLRAMELLQLLLDTMPAGQKPRDGMDHPPYIVGLDDRQRDNLWRKARERAGIPEFTFHDAKHEACTRLAPHLDVVELSHAIGTKDIKLLRDTYYIADASRAAARLPAQLMA